MKSWMLTNFYCPPPMRSRVALQAVGDIVVGSVLGPSSQRANEARIAMFLAGFPETVPVRTVNRRAGPCICRAGPA